ncbi:hypothetical protein PPERSA_06626 [Pseudocohnilembus persalinus]|uniref:Uncharacterized protein n=1 Tax=Pseudocohnilembus persalinus TaxID=266149 RepID=A0A0V0QSJ7_PSEPJ|nr:hypothetical protein PPERSA_06626 [Pseudocohnilembus persalinus]|eukprot:KRX04992.1 hypothetical protein PPERSA_06626 [Pseudocohnilembus persalinus]
MDIEKDTTAQQINSQNGQNQTISITKNAKNINDNNNININNNQSSNENENVEGTQVNQKNSLINQDYTIQKLDFQRIDYSAQENIQVNITDYFKIGTFLDAKDNNFTWCAGIVNSIDMQRNRLTVLFDGWNSQMMEEYSMKSFKLQPYRLYTSDYSGGKQIGCRPDLKFSQQLVEQHIKLMDDMIQQNFYGYNAFQITQQIRGQIFRISDYILTLDLEQLSKAKENVMESEDTQNKDKIELEHDNSRNLSLRL